MLKKIILTSIILAIGISAYVYYQIENAHRLLHMNLKPGYTKKLEKFYTKEGIPCYSIDNMFFVHNKYYFDTDKYTSYYTTLDTTGIKTYTPAAIEKINYFKLDNLLNNYHKNQEQAYSEDLDTVMEMRSRIELTKMQEERRKLKEKASENDSETSHK